MTDYWPHRKRRQAEQLTEMNVWTQTRAKQKQTTKMQYNNHTEIQKANTNCILVLDILSPVKM